MRAKVIEFSGGDGSGKTTAMTYFCDQLEAQGFKVLRTREVGTPHIAACVKLREIILDPNANLDGKTMELVFAAMRIENQKFYDSVADQYDFIVSDRGWLCHLAYTDHNVSREFTHAFYEGFLAEETKMPDKVYLFNVDPQVALGRRQRRGAFVDAIEAKGVAFQELVLQSYLEHAERYSEWAGLNVSIVDANKPLEQIKKIMDSEVELYVASRRAGC